jgi:hypothetical protein
VLNGRRRWLRRALLAWNSRSTERPRGRGTETDLLLCYWRGCGRSRLVLVIKSQPARWRRLFIVRGSFVWNARWWL